MTLSENPPDYVRDDTARDLVTQVARLSRAIETFNRNRQEREDDDSIVPSIRYADTIHPPPRVPRTLSWHQKLRRKQVSVPTATGWSVLGMLIIELGSAIVQGRLRWPW